MYNILLYGFANILVLLAVNCYWLGHVLTVVHLAFILLCYDIYVRVHLITVVATVLIQERQDE